MINELTLNDCLIDGCYYSKAEYQMTCNIDDLHTLTEQNIYYVNVNIPDQQEIDTEFDVFTRTYETIDGEKGVQFDLMDTRSGWMYSAVSCDEHFMDLLVAFSKY
jgi:hypothetical protein